VPITGPLSLGRSEFAAVLRRRFGLDLDEAQVGEFIREYMYGEAGGEATRHGDEEARVDVHALLHSLLHEELSATHAPVPADVHEPLYGRQQRQQVSSSLMLTLRRPLSTEALLTPRHC
jgi:hypothetical protein